MFRSCDPAEPATLPRAPPYSVAATLIDAGAVTVGGIVSITVTMKVAAATRPELSIAVHVTCVLPSGNGNAPDGTQITGRVPSTGSLAEALKTYMAPAGLVASKVALGGTVTVGGVVSITVIETLAVAVA